MAILRKKILITIKIEIVTVRKEIGTLVKIATIAVITTIIARTLKTFRNKIAIIAIKAFKKSSIFSFDKREKFV